MPNVFRTSRRVEFRDTDAAGIMHFSVFFTYMEEAEHEFWRNLGLGVHMTGADGIVSWPRVAARCDYQDRVRFEDMLDIDVRLVRVGEKSATFDFAFSCQGRPVAAGEMTGVCCKISRDGTLRSIAIPREIRDKLPPVTKT